MKTVLKRLDEMAILNDGWLNGEGFKLHSIGLSWFKSTWDKLWPKHVIEPYVYPTLDGSVSLEWDAKDISICVEVNLSTRQAELIVQEDYLVLLENYEIDLTAIEAWEQMAQTVHGFIYSGAKYKV
jgi:hypothetical protein